jgi:hypothetical protein
VFDCRVKKEWFLINSNDIKIKLLRYSKNGWYLFRELLSKIFTLEL